VVPLPLWLLTEIADEMATNLALLAMLLTFGGGETAAPGVVDFDTEIMPILTKGGCNTGACHGAAIGRGGFKLSLYGSDPAMDFRAMVHQLEGRRVNLAKPEQSLLLLKPTESLGHGGGMRFEDDDPSAKLLIQWIQSGVPRLSRRKLTRLEITPRESLVESTGKTVSMKATAHFDDGKSEDVTHWTVFKADDGDAIEIDSNSARIHRRGQHNVTARYLDRVVPFTFIVPLQDEPVDFSAMKRHNFIDEFVLAKLKTLRLPASPPADDAALLRRLRLDLTGTLPSSAEVDKFVHDRSQKKWEKLVERLLKSDEFVDYWTYKFAKLLQIRSQPRETQGALAFHNWLKQQIAKRAAFNDMAETLLTATGDSHEFGPANFYRTVSGPREQAEYVSRVFMGVRLRCANCHNHPLDKWTQDDYHGLSAVFAKIERGRIIKVGTRGEVTNPRTGELAVPRIPGDRYLEQDADGRKELANWLTQSSNPYFAKSLVNRLWKSVLGRGLVEPADDLRATNPPTHPKLLEQLAQDFIEHDYDIRHTLRTIVTSATYRRGSTPLPANSSDTQFYSHALVKPLEAEVLADAIAVVTEVPDKYGDEPLGTRAVTLFDPKIPSASLDILGRCSRAESCENPAASDATAISGGLTTRLHLINGELINRKLSKKGGRLGRLLESKNSDIEVVAELYLVALGRRPNAAENKYWQSQFIGIANQKQRRQFFEDLLWGLLTCREFVTNH